MAIDTWIEAIWHGQESPKTTVTRNGDSMEIGLAGGHYKIVLSRGQREWKSEDGYSGRIDPNTVAWALVDSVLGGMDK
jgi:hypothetical protein